MKFMPRKLLFGSCLFASIATLLLVGLFYALSPVAARAATIPVDTTDYGIANDLQCSLVEAIIAANGNAAGNGCPAGDDTPVDTIALGTDVTYTLPISFDTYTNCQTKDHDRN